MFPGGLEAQDAAADSRPAIMTNRWQENWELLADPALRTEPFDDLKYIPLLPRNPASYVSLGITLRERIESNSVNNFSVGSGSRNTYLLQRFQVHVDVHFDENWQFFTELEDARPFGKQVITPADQNQLDLRLMFLAYAKRFGADTFKARIGRQDFAFDTQRFVSWRDGPNVRQSFDAIWADWETGTWRFLGFLSRPVQYHDLGPFSDTSSEHVIFDMFRVERHVLGLNELSAYYALYGQDTAHYLYAGGRERRQVLDSRFAGSAQGLFWDLEAMGQGGSVGSKDIRAWAVGTRLGYTFDHIVARPQIGIQFDVASGNNGPNAKTLGGFNPLFPNGTYFTLAGYTGYTNLVHIKPSVTLRPLDKLSFISAVGLQWRETTADAVYTQPNAPIAGTAGHGSGYSGVYGQFRMEYAFTRNLTGAVEAVHYQVGNAIRRAGGHDDDYLGVELKFGW